MDKLKKRGMHPRDELPLHVYYDGQLSGEYFADLVFCVYTALAFGASVSVLF
jgi:hypothetical protein